MPPRIIQLPKIADPRGNLTHITGRSEIPFRIRRAYWIYDVPGGATRGGHAFRIQKEFIVALSGSFDVVVDDGKMQTRYHMNRSYYGLYVPSRIWRHMDNFSTNAVALVLSSTLYDRADYVFSRDEFLEMITK